VSNIFMATKRAPFEFEKDPSTGEVRRAAVAPGGTGSVVADQARYLGTNWFSSAMTDADREMAAQHPDGVEASVPGEKLSRLVLLHHDPDEFELFQYQFTANALWYALHSLWETWRTPNFGDEVRSGWAAYLSINEQFASALAGAAADVADPVFLVHDYQLTSVPSFLRDRVGADPRILLFSHLPWPGPDGWRVMPKYLRAEMLERLLAADVVGFFAQRWAWNLLCCIEDNVPEARVDHDAGEVFYRGRRTRVRAMPLGYSPASLEARLPRIDGELEQWASDKELILHAGRTDPIKNAPRAIAAFVGAAQRNANVRAARLLVKMNPNRLYVPGNAEYLASARRMAEDANNTLGTDAVRVVLHDDVSLTLGLLARADVIVLNSVLDGQNLTAFEGSLINQRNCRLILSEGCGASETLKDVATIVNPFDLSELADGISAAVAMDQQAARKQFETRRDVSARYSLPHWVESQLEAVRKCRE
jgi:validamine 7-phosphate valienyltransferase